MYRSITRFIAGHPYSDSIMLDIEDMLDGDEDPTIDPEEASFAALKVEPTDGVSMGDSTYQYWINSLLLDDDNVIIHVMLERGTQYSDIAYAIVHKSMAALKGEVFIGVMLDGLKVNSITDYTEEDVRTWLELLATECGYPEAVGADTFYIQQVVEEQMKADYYLIVADTGIDSYGLFSVSESAERWWIMKFANNGTTIKLVGFQQDNLQMQENPHIVILPQIVKDYIPLTLNETDPDNPYWEYSIADIHAFAKRLRRTPPVAIGIETTLYNAQNITIKVTATASRPPSEVRQELIAQAELLI